MFGLQDLLLRRVELTPDGADGFFARPPEKFCSPGYWVSVAARARARSLTVEQLGIRPDTIGFARAIGIDVALNQEDRYPYGRQGKALSYSPLVVLSDADGVNLATADISQCIRSIFTDPRTARFVRELCFVVGELHDNVWSHGQSTGISNAYRFAKPMSRRGHTCFEFAVADCGPGLLGELRRSGVARRLEIAAEADAISWCVQEGHSSKPPPDEWAQRLPEDIMLNPMGAAGRVLGNGNHHQGLGLYHLIRLVKEFGGDLWLASGDAMLHIDPSGAERYIQLVTPWKGVSLAVRFDTENVLKAGEDPAPDEVDTLLSQLFEEE